MSVVKRGNSKFWYVQFQLDHQTIIRSTRTTDRKIAEQVATKIRAEAHAEIVLGKKKPSSLEATLDRFVKTKIGCANYRNVVSQKRIILRTVNCSVPLTRVDQHLLENFRQLRMEQGCGPQTIKHGINCIVGAIRLAKKHGYECVDVEPPAIRIPNTRLRYLSFDEEHRLLAELNPKREASGMTSFEKRDPERVRLMQDNRDLVILLLDTGARYSEIANIAWDRIDLANKSIRLWRPKVQNESILFMTNRVLAVLARRSESRVSEFVFSSKSLGPRGYSAIAIRKAIRRAGLTDCTIHTLRHTHATRLIQNGLNVYEVRAVLGHTDIRTTMRYAHLEQVQVTGRARDIINAITLEA
jgi:integrase